MERLHAAHHRPFLSRLICVYCILVSLAMAVNKGSDHHDCGRARLRRARASRPQVDRDRRRIGDGR